MDTSQQAVVDFLSRPETFGVDRVERIETHISIVFLAADRAYKLKRAIQLPFLDFSTAEKRAEMCRREVEVNRRTAPDIYIGTLAVTEDGGHLALDGDGEPVDWLVVMRRFDQDDLFDRMAVHGRLARPMVERLADAVATLHMGSEQRADQGGYEGLRWVIDDNVAALRAFAGAPFDGDKVEAYSAAVHRALDRHADLLERRRRDGFVRHGHGDLHLGNICLIDGAPTPFDAIEFNDAIACCDVLYDAAFLVMDLEHRDLAGLANAFFNRYLALSGALDGIAAFGLFLSCRAAVRAKIGAIAARDAAPRDAQRLTDEAAAYLDQAIGYLTPTAPRLIAVGGLSGSGKSSLAEALCPNAGARPGAVLVGSDVTRKCLFGKLPEARLPSDAYGEAVSAGVYRAMRARAAIALAAGYSVIADATFVRPEERAAIAALAGDCGVPFTGLWLDASPAVLRARVRDRYGGASDATGTVVEQQLDYHLGAIDWQRIDASGLPYQVARRGERVLARVGGTPQPGTLGERATPP